MKSMFKEFASIIDERDEIRERLVKQSRDLVRLSKKVIFLVHRAPLLATENDKVVLEANEKMRGIHRAIRTLMKEVPDVESFYRFSRAVSPGFQEFVEAEVFLRFVVAGTLISKAEIEERINAVGEDPLMRMNVQISPMDYVLGVLDATGELMRLAISSISNPSLDPLIQILEFLRNLQVEISKLKLSFSAKDLEQKMRTLQASVLKVENGKSKFVYWIYLFVLTINLFLNL